MGLWIVIWSISQLTACPPPPPDPYGRMNTTMLAIACYESVDHKQEFMTREAAQKFVDDGPKDISFVILGPVEKK